MAGPALFGPFQYARGPAAVERHTKPELGHLDSVPGGVSAQIRRSQAGPVLVHNAQRRAGRGRSAAMVAAGPLLQRLGVPGLGALQGGSPAAWQCRLLKLRAGFAGPASLDGQPASQQPGLEGRARPARTGQVVGDVLQLLDADAGPGTRLVADGQPGPQNGEAGQSGPARTPLVTELAHRCAGFLESAAGLPVQNGGLRQQQSRLGKADLPALLFEL